MESSVYSDVRLIKCWKRTERVPLTLNNFLDNYVRQMFLYGAGSVKETHYLFYSAEVVNLYKTS